MSAVSGRETEHAAGAPAARPPLAVPRRLLRMRSDTALAERFAAGDEAAFDVIYERHRPVVLAVCMGVLGAPPDAEDATQETFSALAVALRTRPPAELRPWLIRVARNASIDTTRRRRHRLLTLDGEIPEVAARPASSGKAELAVVLDGIRELPEGQRMALLMRELGGHSYSEIAEFLETDEDSVKGLIARARVGLRTYREATELSCATARTTIAAEPDGRRYDRTIRRHLRTCGSCRSYREALRDDAKALRAALPIQAGTVATGSLSSGMLSTAKGSLLGYGLTQAATTCAASACAVGAIGGMVFVAPVHKLGLPPILPAVKAAPHRHHTVARPTATKHVVVASHRAAPSSYPSASSNGYRPNVAPAKPTPTPTPAAAAPHRRPEPTVTRVKLPTLPPAHRTSAPAESTPVSVTSHPTPVTTRPPSGTSSSSTATSSPATPATQASPTQTAGHPTGDPTTPPSSGASPTSQSGGGQGSPSAGASSPTPYGGAHQGAPVHVIIGGFSPATPQSSSSTDSPSASAAAASDAAAPATSPAPADASTSTTSTTTTTVPTYTRPVAGGSHGPILGHSLSGARHVVTWHQVAPAQPSGSVGTTSTASPDGGTSTSTSTSAASASATSASSPSTASPSVHAFIGGR